MRKFLKKKQGQVLIVAITAMFMLVVFAFAVIEYGNLIFEKIHMQNIADSGAMEGGLWYARALNIISLSNKILIVVTGTALIATAASLGTTWPFWQQVLNWYIKIQDFFAGTGESENFRAMPMANAGAVVINGARNGGVISLPMFNIENFKDKKFVPSFNLKRRTLADLLDPESLDDKYYYIEHATQKRIDVPKEEVKTNRAGKKYHSKDGKFVIKQEFICGEGEGALPDDFRKGLENLKNLKNDFPVLGDVVDEVTKRLPLDIVETNPHTVLVVSFKTGIKQKLGSGFFKNISGGEIKPSVLISSAFVRIDGGSMCFLTMDGANYTPYLDHIVLPRLDFAPDSGSISALDGMGDFLGRNAGSFNSNLGKVAEFMDKASGFVVDYNILH